jgi:tRNA dimethylallyltransferase
MIVMNKLIVILGPTASGKSTLSLALAKKFSGEIISADSRQVYKGMDIGTGKISKKDQRIVPHHLLDVASPKKQFTVADFKNLGAKAIKKIIAKKKVPFIVGGTAFYIYSLIDDWNIPEVRPNPKLRKELAKKTTAQLFAMLKELRSNSSKKYRQQKSRTTHPCNRNHQSYRCTRPYDLQPKTYNLSLASRNQEGPKRTLQTHRQTLEERLKAGMVAEVKKLKKSGLSWKKLESFGLEYRFIALHLQDLITYDEMVEQLKNAIHHFSKRQMTWFKRDSRIHWIKNQKQAEKLIQNYLKK